MFTRPKTLLIRQRLRALVNKEAQKLTGFPNRCSTYKDCIYAWPEKERRKSISYKLVGPNEDYSHVDRYCNHYMKEVSYITVDIPEHKRLSEISHSIRPNEGKVWRRGWTDSYWDYNEVRNKERTIADYRLAVQDFEECMAVTEESADCKSNQ